MVENGSGNESNEPKKKQEITERLAVLSSGLIILSVVLIIIAGSVGVAWRVFKLAAGIE